MDTQEKNILNNFKEILGQYCAINQFVELSKRCFIANHDVELNDRKAFIALATQNAVTLTSSDPDKMVHYISRSYIVNVHLCLETFLKKAYQQIKDFGSGIFHNKLQGESWLECIVKNTVGNNIPKEKQALLDLCEYYRLIRNTAVHDLCDIKSHSKEYIKLQKYDFKTETKFAKLSAPNIYENISFDDFVMYSRSCVELATYLFYNISYDYEKIIINAPQSQIQKWKTYTQQRCEKAILAYINTLFKVDDSLESQLPHLAKSIMAR